MEKEYQIYKTLYIRDLLDKENISLLTPTQLEEKYKTISSRLELDKDNIWLKNTKEKYQKMIDSTQNTATTFWIEKNDISISDNNKELEKEKKKALSFFSNKNILILAGAGMSVDSSLKTFENISLSKDKDISYEFDSFDKAIPHDGYVFLKNLKKDKNIFIMTTNIDNLFLKAGFDKNRVYECHGNYSNRWCENCDVLYKNTKEWKCEKCLRNLTPMFIKLGKPGEIDYSFLKEGEERLKNWMKDCDNNFTILEIGCGVMVPTLRDYSEILLEKYEKVNLIRVNPSHCFYFHKNNEKKVSLLEMGILEAIDYFKISI